MALDLKAIREALEAATPGPWAASEGEPDDVVVWGPGENEYLATVSVAGRVTMCLMPGEEPTPAQKVCFDIDAANAALIALLRNNAPALLSAAEEVGRLRDEAQRQAAEIVSGMRENRRLRVELAEALEQRNALAGIYSSILDGPGCQYTPRQQALDERWPDWNDWRKELDND